MVKLKLAVILTFLIIAAGITASLLLPVPEVMSPLAFYAFFGMAYASAVLFISSSVLFLMGFGSFTGRLKRTYALICIGFILLGVSMLELPTLLSAGLLESINREKGYIIALPFIASIIILLVGTNKLARLFSVKSVTLTWWLPVVSIGVLAGLMFVVPHVPTVVAEQEYDRSVAGAMTCWVILTFCLIHVLKIKKVAGVTYTPGLAWLALCFIFSSLVAAGGVVGRIFYGDDSSYAITAYTLVPLVPAGVLLLRSAYTFNRIPTTVIEGGAEARTFFGKPQRRKKRADVSSIDIVVYTAQLASTTQTVDDILDGLRSITSRMAADSKLTAGEQQTLLHIYLRLENYLTTQEPVRRFSRLEVRQQVTSGLNLGSNTTETFWDSLPSLQASDEHSSVPPVPEPHPAV